MGRKKRFISMLLSLVLIITALPQNLLLAATEAAASHVVISQVYGGGGSSGATYKNDFIELYNPTNSDIDLTGWSVQYASAAGTSWNRTALTGDIKAHCFYLIQEAAGSGGTVDLPTPDATGNLNMSAANGKVALAKVNTSISGITDSAVIDFVGFGSASVYEGSGATDALSATLSAARNTDWVDTDDNKSNFKTQSPNPRNSASPASVPTTDGDEETVVGNVTANPASGEIAAGTKINLSTVTTDAVIQYNLNSTGWTTGSSIILEDSDFIGTSATATLCAKATKDGLTDSAESTFTYTKQAAAGVIAIKQAREKASGSKVTVEGIVTRAIQSSATGTNSCTLYIQDGTAGIAVFKSGISLTTYSIGAKVQVTGTLGTNKGVLQIQPAALSDIVTQSAALAPRTPDIVTIDTLNTTAYEGKLVKLEGVKLSTIATNSNHTIADEMTNASMTMRCTENATLPSTEFAANDRIDVIGIAANYSGTAQLVVSKITDITKSVPLAVEGVTALPAGGSSLPLNGSVSLATVTLGTSIIYTVNGGTEQTINTNTGTISIPAFNQTGATAVIKAKATNGTYITPERTFIYTQAKASTVETSIPSGAVTTGSQIILTTKTIPATIKYILTKKVGLPEQSISPETVYSVPIILTEDMLPAKITAWAQSPNYLDSDKVDFNYKAGTGGTKRNYFGQLHSHTAENSDGAGTLEEAYTYARDVAKLDFFAVTDHSNSFDDAPTGDKAGTYNLGSYNASNVKWQNGQTAAVNARRDNFVSVYAYEMTWSNGPGHMNTFNTEGFVSRNNTELNSKTGDAGLKAYYELLKATPNSISQFNHPGETFGNFNNFSYYDPTIDQRVTLLEVGNGEGAVGSGGYFRSYDEYNKALDKGWHVAPTNNQDNHKKLWGNANTARTVIYTDDLSVDGLYQALRNRHVYATEDNDLDIVYTLNNQELGTIIDTVPGSAVFNAAVNDPDTSDKIQSVSIISNGGKSIYTKEFNTQNAVLNYTIPNPQSGYYYIKVVEGDGDIAVTAPVWLGKAPAVGITDVKCSAAMPVTNEALTFSTEIFNNESAPITLKSISYEVKNGEQIASSAPNATISSNGSYTHAQSYTPSTAGIKEIIITAVINVNGEDKTFTKEIKLNVRDADQLVYVGIDGSHYNEYVAGNYKDSMGNFGLLAANYNVRTVQLNTKEELLAALANPKYQMMVFTAPSRRNGTTGRVPYATYSDDEIAAITDFAKSGKTVIVTGWSDFYENYANVKGDALNLHMAGQQNKLLKALGASLRISDDAAVDDKSNGGQSQRLYLTDYNGFVSPLTKGIIDGQVYSSYGGSTIYAATADESPASALPASVKPIISGHDTTYSKDSDSDGFGFADKTTNIPKYNNKMLLTASEILNHSNGINSEVIVAGAAFMSNFEIQATVENAGTLNYSNYNILENIIADVNPAIITSIADVKKAPVGTEFTIEGTATSSVNDGTDNNKGFFDCIYVQDATGGINLFPVSSGVEAGQKIRVKGTVSAYQGERQLKVSKVSVIDPAVNPIVPTEVSTADAMLPANTGRLVKITGTVTDVIMDKGVVGQMTVNDGSGPALVYINGYITKSKNLSFIQKGVKVCVTALASVGENLQSQTDFLPRLRVRDRGEILFAETPAASTGGGTSSPAAPVQKDHSNTATMQVPVTQAISQNKTVSIKKDNAVVQVSAEALLGSLSEKDKKDAQAQLNIMLKKLEEKEAKDILTKAPIGEGQRFNELGAGIFNVEMNFNNNGVNTQRIAAVTQPMKFQIDLSKAAVKDPSKLTGVHYVKNAAGEVQVQLFGGTYDKETKIFSFMATEAGDYSVVEANNLLQLSLQIGSKTTIVNQREIQNRIAPQMIGGRAMLPLRDIGEAMSAEFKWNEKTKKASISMGGKTLELEAGNQSDSFNGSAIIIDGRILVSARYVAEAFGANVIWAPVDKQVLIVK